MGILNQFTFDIKINPPPESPIHINVNVSPRNLMQFGFNLPVEISTASRFRKPPLNIPLSSITVMAHFDTGASVTSIDIGLAKHLNLLVMGQTESRTAAGLQTMPNFPLLTFLFYLFS